jgi:two-component system, OmpR family, response regulator
LHILLAEDDIKTALSVQEGLALHGVTSSHAGDGALAFDLCRKESFDVLIVDRMMPKMDGLSLITALRESGIQTPVLILSALGEVDDRVLGLRAGADDYLVKPFALDELIARLEVLVRRNQGGDQSALVCGPLHLDMLKRQARRDNEILDLMPREFAMLSYLVENAGQVVTRTMLLEHIFQLQFDPQTNIIDVHMSRLRAKVDKGFPIALIKTVRGIGYKIDEH